MSELLKEGPVRKFLRERETLVPRKKILGGSHSPVFLPSEVAAITGLSEADARAFLKTVVDEPFLYVIYDDLGRAVDWDTYRDQEGIEYKARGRLPARPEFRSYKIYEAKLKLDMIEEKWRW